ncbi:MAG: hypothetical protein IPL78_07745 [Chloroflexi bacterium]|nr:hypothetical protein [Chloroflexota bacterium]
MSHELRTPLNTILGMSEALQEEVYGSLNRKQLDSLHHIEESGRHLLTLINDILDLSKIEVGQLVLDIEPVFVPDLCQASLRLVQQSAHKKQLSVALNLDPDVSVIAGDERRLKQILVNLLSNAVKFTPSGGQIGLDVQASLDKTRVAFTVWDTGIGIAAADIPRLFQPFMQLDSRLAREYGGTGLGLSLVYRMTRLHQGSVPCRVNRDKEADSPCRSLARRNEGWRRGRGIIHPVLFHPPIRHYSYWPKTTKRMFRPTSATSPPKGIRSSSPATAKKS